MARSMDEFRNKLSSVSAMDGETVSQLQPIQNNVFDSFAWAKGMKGDLESLVAKLKKHDALRAEQLRMLHERNEEKVARIDKANAFAQATAVADLVERFDIEPFSDFSAK